MGRLRQEEEVTSTNDTDSPQLKLKLYMERERKPLAQGMQAHYSAKLSRYSGAGIRVMTRIIKMLPLINV